MSTAKILAAEMALIAEAIKYVGTVEYPPHSNRGPEIDYWLQQVRSPLGSPWCAAFVWSMGKQAVGVSWPVPRTGRVQDMVDWARPLNIIHEHPRLGDLVVLYFRSLSRYAHVGIVTAVHGDVCDTIEGNTNPSGGREGYGVFRRTRRAGPTVRFLRWASVVR